MSVLACPRSMSTSLALLTALVFVPAGCARAQPDNDAASTSAAPPVAVVDVNVVPMDEDRVLTRHTVVVQDGRIVAVGPAGDVAIPEGAIQVEGQGRYLMPGLAEMHGHLPSGNPQYAEDVLFLYVANGVTLVRGMQGARPHLELRDRIARGELIGPTLFVAGPAFGGNNARTPEAAANLVREQHAAGFDLLKVMNMSREAYEAMARTARELDIPFAGHVPGSVGIEGAIAARQATVDHLDRYLEYLAAGGPIPEARGPGFFGSGVAEFADTSRISAIVAATREAGVWNVPTLSLIENLAMPDAPEVMIQAPEMRYMPRDVRDDWVNAKRSYQQRPDFQLPAVQRLVELRRQLVKALHDAGAPLLLGSDAPQWFNVPGFSLHKEMGMMVNAGLTPYEVLVTGTRNPAAYFGTPNEFGTVEVGRRADLILLEANPLEDISNTRRIAGVIVRGQWLPRDEIDRRLEEIAARAG